MTFKQQFKVVMKKPINFTRIDYSLPENKLTFKKALIMKCLDCCAGVLKVARDCGNKNCCLYLFKKNFPTGKDETEKDTKQISSEKPKRKYHFKKKNDAL